MFLSLSPQSINFKKSFKICLNFLHSSYLILKVLNCFFFVPLTEASLLAKPEVRGQGNLFYFMTWKEPQAHMTKGVSRGRGEGQGLHYIQPVQSTALPVMFSWEFCDSEVASLTFPITRGILIYVT